jgi:hypothetical protein
MEDVVVTLKLAYSLAVSAGLCLASLGAAQGPQQTNSALAPAAADQAIVDAIAAKIAATPSLSGLTIQVVCQKGVVEVSGTVGDAAQHDAVVHAARSTKNVSLVKDNLAGGAIVQPVNLPMQPSQPEPLGAPAPAGVGGTDPFPLNGGFAGGFNMAPPRMPAYAWPTYAPYNNYSRVAYPTEYPAAAFPFIGPFYPFPKVPLGYRAIKLEWEDGHWWYGRTAVNKDWWKVRYW